MLRVRPTNTASVFTSTTTTHFASKRLLSSTEAKLHRMQTSPPNYDDVILGFNNNEKIYYMLLSRSSPVDRGVTSSAGRNIFSMSYNYDRLHVCMKHVCNQSLAATSLQKWSVPSFPLTCLPSLIFPSLLHLPGPYP